MTEDDYKTIQGFNNKALEDYPADTRVAQTAVFSNILADIARQTTIIAEQLTEMNSRQESDSNFKQTVDAYKDVEPTR